MAFLLPTGTSILRANPFFDKDHSQFLCLIQEEADFCRDGLTLGLSNSDTRLHDSLLRAESREITDIISVSTDKSP